MPAPTPLPEPHEPGSSAPSSAEAILSAVVFSAREFLGRPDWSSVLESVLARLGRATGAHQVRVFRNDSVSDDLPARTSLIAQWIAPGAPAGTPVDQLQHITIRSVGLARWEQALSHGEPIVGLRHELPATEQPMMEVQGVVSLAIMPIFVGTRWWGLIGFYDSFHPRIWSRLDLDALAGAAGIIGAAYARREMEEQIATAVEQERQAAQALRRSEDRYRLLVNATMEGLVIHDGERIVDANPSVAHTLGYTSVEETIGRNPLEFVHPDFRAEVRRRLEAHDEHPYEAMILRKDGSAFPAELKASDFTVEDRRLRVVCIRDISERKDVEQMQQRMVEERAAYAASEQMRQSAEFLLDASRILASSFDTTTTLRQLAHVAVRFLADFDVVTLYDGGEPELVAVVHADDAQQELLNRVVRVWCEHWDHDHPLSVAQRTGEPFLIPVLTDPARDAMGADAEHRRQLAELETVSLMAVPISGGGKLIGSMLFASTRENRVYTQQHLALALELARRAADAVLSARAYHAALAAIHARDDMLAVVAHDLRTPLNTITAGSALALEALPDTPDATARRPLEMIQRAAHHMQRLIEDLLDATRIEVGQFPLDFERASAEMIIADAVETLQPLAATAGLHIGTDIAPGLPQFRADRVRLHQVLSNLVGNAIKFTPRGGSVVISAQRLDDSIQFGVSDTGRGIAPEQLPHIFGKFWQARPDRHSLGLGLAIAKGIVEAHGGSIRAESEPGVGTTFLFTIPLAPPD